MRNYCERSFLQAWRTSIHRYYCRVAVKRWLFRTLKSLFLVWRLQQDLYEFIIYENLLQNVTICNFRADKTLYRNSLLLIFISMPWLSSFCTHCLSKSAFLIAQSSQALISSMYFHVLFKCTVSKHLWPLFMHYPPKIEFLTAARTILKR